MKSLETSTTNTNNTSITTTSYDDSDDELGAEIYRTSQTAQILREEKNAMSTSTQTTTRKSSRLKPVSPDAKSKLPPLQLSVLDSKATSTDNKKNTKKIIRSNKRKAAVVSVDDDVCKEVASWQHNESLQKWKVSSSALLGEEGFV